MRLMSPARRCSTDFRRGAATRELRHALIVLNIVAFARHRRLIVWRVLSLRRNPSTKDPENLTPFLADEDLEGRGSSACSAGRSSS